jgi:hypothetical protein
VRGQLRCHVIFELLVNFASSFHLQYAFDDFAVSQVAKLLGKTDAAEKVCDPILKVQCDDTTQCNWDSTQQELETL